METGQSAYTAAAKEPKGRLLRKVRTMNNKKAFGHDSSIGRRVFSRSRENMHAPFSQ